MGFGFGRKPKKQAENIILDGEIVARLRTGLNGIFQVTDLTVPRQARQGLVVFNGHLLLNDADQAYSEIADRWAPLAYTPLLRNFQNQHQVVATPGLIRPRPAKAWINLVLFLATLLSVLFVGALNSGVNPLDNPAALVEGMPFAFTLLVILGAHEFGHYFAARHHQVSVTLPYFIPMPLSFVGTFGAFIQLRSPVRNRNQLFDVGVAGPLAGLVLAIPLLFVGLALSPMGPLPTEGGYILEGNSLFYLAAKFLVFGQILPNNGVDVMLHPIAFAAWFGLLVTAFNLFPIGQLDGGHVVYGLIGEKIRTAGFIFVGVLVLMGALLWQGWITWALLIFLLGVGHPPPLNDITPLDSKRRLLAFFVIFLFVLLFVPIPLKVIG